MDTKTRNELLDEQSAKFMGFAKVHRFIDKLCVQKYGDTPNNNIPWSPTKNAEQMLEIMNKYKISLTYIPAEDEWLATAIVEMTVPTILMTGQNKDIRIAVVECLIECGMRG
jgi:hypothetical protein